MFHRYGFTILEFMLALFLTSLLMLMVFQGYHQVLRIYREMKEEHSFRSDFLLSEGLRRQLSALYCEPVNYAGRNIKFFYFRENVLSFITNFSLRGPVLVVYCFEPEATIYFERPYLGEKIPEHPEELLEGDEIFGRFKTRVYSAKLLRRTEEETEEIKELLPGRNFKDLMLQLSGPRGFQRELPVPFCS